LAIVKAFLLDEALHETLSSVGADGEVTLDQIDAYVRQRFSHEAHILVIRWRALMLPLPHRGGPTSAR
jgi:hypothetical protein